MVERTLGAGSRISILYTQTLTALTTLLSLKTGMGTKAPPPIATYESPGPVHRHHARFRTSGWQVMTVTGWDPHSTRFSRGRREFFQVLHWVRRRSTTKIPPGTTPTDRQSYGSPMCRVWVLWSSSIQIRCNSYIIYIDPPRRSVNDARPVPNQTIGVK